MRIAGDLRTVWITGAGVVSPIGTSLPEMFDSLEQVRPALRTIRRFDPSRLRTAVAGEVDRDALIARLGLATIELPFLKEGLLLSDNPKLAFALGACAQALGLDESEVRALASGAPAGTGRPWMAGVGLYTTAGLEEIGLGELGSTLTERTHVCRELPPTFLGEVLARVFGLRGQPPVTMVSACASSTQSIGEAFRAVRHGTIERALAGGTDSMIHPYGINAFNSLSALAEGDAPACRLAPFDRQRTGTLLGEGAAYVLLETEEAARQSGHRPLAEVVGYGSSLDGHHPVKPHPEGAGAAAAMERALADGAVPPDSVEYVNAHGSGTYHNDIAETVAIHRVFGQHARSLKVSSTKPYHGHLLTAGGAIELLSLLFCFARGLVPPTLNLSSPDARCDLDYVPGDPARCPVDTAITNSFGLNGQNGVLVLRSVSRAPHRVCVGKDSPSAVS